MSKLKLYDVPISGNCYKIRLLLSMLDIDYEKQIVDLPSGESQTQEYKENVNPRGEVPVLVDGENIIWDSMAILGYLAREYGEDSWFPQEPLSQARVMQWLALSENELLYGLARSRAALIFKRPFNLEQCQAEAHNGLSVMDSHLTDNQWLANNSPSIADIACYPYISLAHQGEVSLDDYPQVQRWMKDFEALQGWVALTPD